MLQQKLFKSFNLAYIERFPRTSNSHDDALATLTSAIESDLKRTIEVDFLPKPSIDAEQFCYLVFDIKADMGPCWMNPIICYLRD